MGIFDFKITTRRNNDNEYEDFNSDEEMYNGGFDGEYESIISEDDVSFNDAPVSVALKIINPKSYDEASTIADFLLNGNTVLLNVEGLEREPAIRLLDYLSGAVRMIGGVMTKVGKTTIVVAPKNVDVSSIEAMVGSNN